MKYGIKVGQIYTAADGSRAGHIVTDVVAFADFDDVVTNPFTPAGFKGDGNRIDAFKLAVIRYQLVDVAPDWMPTAI